MLIDGHVYIWHKSSGIAVERLDAHHPRCNSVTWNPADPCMFATCGDDGKIKMYVYLRCCHWYDWVTDLWIIAGQTKNGYGRLRINRYIRMGRRVGAVLGIAAAGGIPGKF